MRRALPLMSFLALAEQVRAAEPSCSTAFTDADLRALVARARSAVDAGDVADHRRTLDELFDAVPCLQNQLPVRPWADFLVTEAIVRYAEDSVTWTVPLQLALELVPDHPDVPAHLIADYDPPARPAGEDAIVPEGVLLLVDGRVMPERVPRLAGLHIAQIWRDGAWESALLRGTQVPAAWLEVEDEAEAPPRGGSWGTLGTTGGFATWGQTVREGSSLEPASWSGIGFGATTHGAVELNRGVGLFWTGGLSGWSGEGRGGVGFGSGFAGVSLFDAPIAVWLGGGGAVTRVTLSPDDGPDGERALWLPHYLVGLSSRGRLGLPLDAALAGGWGPWGAHAQAHAGVTLADVGPVGVRVGGQMHFATATLVDLQRPGSPVEGSAGVWTGGLTLGLAWDRGR